MAALLDSIEGTPMSVTNEDELDAMETFWVKIIKGLRKLDIKCTYQTESIIQSYVDTFTAETEALQVEHEWISSILHGEDVNKNDLDPEIYDRFLLIMQIQERLAVYQSSLKYMRCAREYSNELLASRQAGQVTSGSAPGVPSVAVAPTYASATPTKEPLADATIADDAAVTPSKSQEASSSTPVTPSTAVNSDASTAQSSTKEESGYFPGKYLSKLTPTGAKSKKEGYYPGKYLNKFIKKVQHGQDVVRGHAMSMEAEPELEPEDLLAYCDAIKMQACALLDADIEDVDAIDSALEVKLARLLTLNNSVGSGSN